MKILLISYGLPKNPGNNSSSYYYMLHSGDYKGDRMKKVFSDWKGLDEKTKNDFNAKFIKVCYNILFYFFYIITFFSYKRTKKNIVKIKRNSKKNFHYNV